VIELSRVLSRLALETEEVLSYALAVPLSGGISSLCGGAGESDPGTITGVFGGQLR
jgi:hypothetical protein